MIRHIIAGAALIATLFTFWYMYQVDVEVDALGKVDKIFAKSQMMIDMAKKSADTATVTQVATQEVVKDKHEEEDKLKALREKAGNVGGFKVSSLYKSKCASCHGANGEGGVGPKIIGQSYEKVSQDLEDFKTGAKKNYVMYGLLQNLSDEELDSLSKEISEFTDRAKAME